MCFCGSFGIQVEDHETLLEPKTEEGHSEKAVPCPGGRLTDYGPGYRLRNSPNSLGTQV